MKKILLVLLLLIACVSIVQAETYTFEFNQIEKLEDNLTYVKENDEELPWCIQEEEGSCSLHNAKFKIKAFNQELLDKKEQARLEAERIEAERKEAERQAYLASLPKTVNFDNYISYIEGTKNPDRQGLVDAGYLMHDEDDYFHHNTGKFLELFKSIKQGDTVVIGGKYFTAASFEYATVVEEIYMIGNTSGNDSWMDGNPDLVTCSGGPTDPGRMVWHLQAQ